MLIAPSMLSCDFSKIGEELSRMEQAKADLIHLDVMDGHFVPNITFGAPVIKKLRKCTGLPFDVHLMISEPLKYINDFAAAGADLIVFHAESDSDIRKTIGKIKACGKKAGLAVKPATPARALFNYLDDLSLALIMTVEPGFGGQNFMADMLPKVREVKNEIRRRGLDTLVEVDGGITIDTLALAASAGADICVAGTAVFAAEDARQAVDSLRSAAQKPSS